MALGSNLEFLSSSFPSTGQDSLIHTWLLLLLWDYGVLASASYNTKERVWGPCSAFFLMELEE